MLYPPVNGASLGSFFCRLPFLTGILAFRLLGLGSYLMRATASHSNEGRLEYLGQTPKSALSI